MTNNRDQMSLPFPHSPKERIKRALWGYLERLPDKRKHVGVSKHRHHKRSVKKSTGCGRLRARHPQCVGRQ
jgi:hypothetical protein